MIHPNIATGPHLRAYGARIGRDGLAQRVQELVREYSAKDNSYKGAMTLAGALQVLAEAAMYDDYWEEQVRKGHLSEVHTLQTMHQEKSNGT